MLALYSRRWCSWMKRRPPLRASAGMWCRCMTIRPSSAALPSLMQLRRWVFSLLKRGSERSASAPVIGIVQPSSSNVHTFGKASSSACNRAPFVVLGTSSDSEPFPASTASTSGVHYPEKQVSADHPSRPSDHPRSQQQLQSAAWWWCWGQCRILLPPHACQLGIYPLAALQHLPRMGWPHLPWNAHLLQMPEHWLCAADTWSCEVSPQCCLQLLPVPWLHRTTAYSVHPLPCRQSRFCLITWSTWTV